MIAAFDLFLMKYASQNCSTSATEKSAWRAVFQTDRIPAADADIGQFRRLEIGLECAEDLAGSL